MLDPQIKFFSTCVQSTSFAGKDFGSKVAQLARWSEQYGCEGILVYTDNSLVDPWLVSQIIIHNTNRLCPLVAVQPVYMHPYGVAKMVSTFAFLYGRRLYLNMVAGGFKNDLTTLNDNTPHDKRYERLAEYTKIIKHLLSSAFPMNYKGEFYQLHNLIMTPPMPQALTPGIFLSGSSEAGLAAAQAVGATAIMYPRPASEYENTAAAHGLQCGIRVGIIARAHDDQAWTVARERFPEDRRGQLAQKLAMKTSDSVWHKQLSELAADTKSGSATYWLWPFENYKTFCPYLVGSYATVCKELAAYVAVGYRTFVLDTPSSEEDLLHTSLVFQSLSKNLKEQECHNKANATEKGHASASSTFIKEGRLGTAP